MTVTTSRFANRVKKGAAWLDKKMPGWREKINVETLNTFSAGRCVIGQTFGDYNTWNNEYSDAFCFRHGFNLCDSLSKYEVYRRELTMAWAKEIAEEVHEKV